MHNHGLNLSLAIIKAVLESFSVYLLLQAHMSNGQTQDVCFWNRTSPIGVNTFLNGEYSYNGTFNSRPYYVKSLYRTTCSLRTQLYLYYDSIWCISETLGAGWAHSYAVCDTDGDPTESCNNIWTVGGDIDPDVSLSYGLCPEWHCDEIRTSLSGKCSGPFDYKYGTNTWYNASKGMYWFFDEGLFDWACTSLPPEPCAYSYNARTNLTVSGWIDLSRNQTIDVPFRYPSGSEIIECIGIPTLHPSNAPTSAPTNTTVQPSVAPTMAPSYTPSHMTTMTSEASMELSFIPTYIMSRVAASEDLGAMHNYDQFQRQLYDLNKLYQQITLTYGASISILILCAYVDAKFIRLNDYLRVGAMITFMLQTLDMLSDCFFVTQVYMYIDRSIIYWIIFVFSIFFIILPLTTSIMQLQQYVQKHWLKVDRVREWVLVYSKLLLGLSIFTGSSFSAVSLLNSFVFKLDLFDMGLTNRQLRAFGIKRVYSVVLMENVPQLMLQTIYIVCLNGVNDPIVISSIVFSVISIIISILSMTWEKSIYETQNYVIVTMDITGNCVLAQAKKCKTCREKLTIALAALFGVHQTTVEVLKPNNITQGLALQVYVYITDVNTKIMDYKRILIEKNKSGELKRIFEHNWNLSEAPMIGNITSNIIASKKVQKQQTEQIKVVTDTSTSGVREIVTLIK